MRPTTKLSPIPVLLVAALVTMALPAAAGRVADRTWYLTNNLEEHRSGNNTTFGPGFAMREGGGNGAFPTGVLLAADLNNFRSRVWSATPPAGASNFGTATWTVSFGGESVITDLRFIVGAWDHAKAEFDPAPGEPAAVGVTRTASFTPSSTFVVPAGRDLGLRVWVPGDADTPSVIDVWSPLGNDSPSTLTLG